MKMNYFSKPALASIQFVVGRLPTASVVVNDITVSRRHAVFRADHERVAWTVADEEGSCLCGLGKKATIQLY